MQSTTLHPGIKVQHNPALLNTNVHVLSVAGSARTYRQLSEWLQRRPLRLIDPSAELVSDGRRSHVACAFAQRLILFCTDQLFLQSVQHRLSDRLIIEQLIPQTAKDICSQQRW